MILIVQFLCVTDYSNLSTSAWLSQRVTELGCICYFQQGLAVKKKTQRARPLTGNLKPSDQVIEIHCIMGKMSI